MNPIDIATGPVVRVLLVMAVALAGAGATSTPAWAQTAQTQVPVLPPVTVTGQREAGGPSLTQPDLPAARERMQRIPGGANVIDAETYREGRASTLSDALGYSPGVYIQPRFGAEESRISIRGSGIQRTFHLRGLKLMQDGVPLNLADGSGDFQAVEPLATRYIEVYRGANALQYGSSTLGGAINYVSPTGHDASPAQLRAELGSFDYRRLHGSSGRAFEKADYFASYSTFDQEGFRRHARQDTQRFFGNVGYRFNADVETRFYLAHVNTVSELPGNLTKEQMQADPRQAAVANVTGNQKRDFDLNRISNKTVWRFGENRIEVSGYYSDKLLFHPIFQVLDQDGQDYGIELRWISDATLGGRRNRFVAGYAPSRGELRDDRFVNVGGDRGARTNQFDQTATNQDFYFENQHYVVPQWALVVGAQHTRATRDNRDLFVAGTPADPVSQSFNVGYSGTSPKIGILYDYQPGVQFFANVSQSYEPPSFGELTGGAQPVINRAQKATTFELGSRGAMRAADWDVAFYHSRVTDELMSIATNVVGQSITVNAPKTEHQGIELGLTVRPLSGFEWRNALLMNRFRFDGDPTFGNNTLPGLPKSFLRSELVYRWGNGFYAGPSLEWSPREYPVDMGNTLFADSYAIWGIKVGQKIDKRWAWFIEGRNLGDKIYASATNVARVATDSGGAHFLPGDGRSIYAGLQWQM